jgi:hypothetical protein
VTRLRLRAARPLGLAIAAAAIFWALAHGLDAGALFMAPALLLLIPLLKGRYVCEERLIALIARPRPVRAPRQIAKPRALASCIRTGELMARSLAVRPPPAQLT